MKKILLILLVVTFSSSAFADPKMELKMAKKSRKGKKKKANKKRKR